ncbi:MAG: hypothetical protein M3R72_11780 [Bacteroidota bacterium]|nr:hypothetical protein [Bacteroidota bacterium]
MKRFIRRLFYWELWPFNIIYAPLGIVWLYYAIKARAFWFFSNVNPTLTFSGFEGESKREMYEQMPRNLYPSTVYVSAAEEPIYIAKHLQEAGISFPFIAKPEIGTQGLMCRKINDMNELLRYHSFINANYVIQTFVDLAEEYSVFYIRYPNEKRGKITGLILKNYLSVVGDGTSTLQQLILKDSKAKYRTEELFAKHKHNLHCIVANGKKYELSYMGNHNRGARFINLHNEIDEPLCAVFDAIHQTMPQFYYGRYDLKCTSLRDLKKGNNIQILEYNGTGAEPNHIYDCGMSYFTALQTIVQHWRDMYLIGKINRKKGIRCYSFLQGRKHMKGTKCIYDQLRKKDATLNF